MPCYHPLRAFRTPQGPITFGKPKWSDLPLDLPCGQCIGCKIALSQTWALRCVHEAQMHDRNSFVTLTYSPEHLPSDGSLSLEHWQKFAKRLRKRIGSFRFFMCGEYGDENARPHYHACIFGVDFSGDRSFHTEHLGNKLYTSPLLTEVWGKGYCSVGSLTFESAAYVARYVCKKLTGEAALIRYMGVDMTTGEELPPLRREFVSMSRRPGLGAKWFERYRSDVYPSDEVVLEGRRFRPPRYYDDKLSEEELSFFKERRQQAVGARLADLSFDRLKVREGVLKRKLRLCKRII